MVPKQMKAVIFEQYGDADVLKYTDFRVPTLERGEALVNVHAVSLNGYDLMARAGRYKPNKGKFPHILGGDLAVSSLRSGRRRHAICRWERA